MRRKYKLTGFARFSIFLLFISPFCYFGATQYQNNPKVKDMVDNAVEKIESKTKEITIEIESNKTDAEELKDEIDDLQKEIDQLLKIKKDKENDLAKLEVLRIEA